MTSGVTNEDLICGELRKPDGEGRKDRSTVRKAIETMLPIKNLANHNSPESGFGFKL
ncbi:hypothetical protein APA_2390 [Pseudanabaena sp. lw0831]|uniref:hypothetical protein n=1 Tax=Pseudanabaena sp. lw0831 TaxID=1357935 RepID=UPI001914E836|nr:hypothetical protein [Pseudanabaena sp. lw0831]GBO54442.1 hypothetical protein APA_2390 [Pseudanabaena sp. lw0831]